VSDHVVATGSRRFDPALLAPKEAIGVAGFDRLDLRIGRVVAAAPFPAARKPSLRVRVDFGPLIGELETSAQITHYDPQELVGRLVVGAVNLGVRRIAGLESSFLILGGLHADGTVALLAPDEALPPGSVVA
jgi:tRNA-binding protein